MLEYGPIPVSRFKEEAAHVFEALEAGRRVLISRHGQVVASIEPASLDVHGPELAAFALRDNAVAELSASHISQRSPSEAIHRAEAGTHSLLTRSNKVYGVLTGRPPAAEDLKNVDEQERALAAFEREHPEASAEEFARASRAVASGTASLPLDSRPKPVLTASLPSRPEGRFPVTEHADETLVDALLVKGLALEDTNERAAAAATFQAAIDRFDRHPDVRVRSRVARALVELAKLRVAEGHAQDAVELAEEAVDMLGADVRRLPPTAIGPG